LLAEAFKHGSPIARASSVTATSSPSICPHLTDPAYHRELATRIKEDGVLSRDAYGMRAARRRSTRTAARPTCA